MIESILKSSNIVLVYNDIKSKKNLDILYQFIKLCKKNQEYKIENFNNISNVPVKYKTILHSDFVLSIKSDKIKIIKNRYGYDNKEIDLSISELFNLLRNKKIKKILNNIYQ